ncbi:TrkH family potassium uptake protein [Kangiella sediminilitoris]|uniref:Trk system potassium uptake protein n=1 Tax=Kangiella sediminilitoris TaxID=1144748 RepID=A0A1B3BDV6_9GAMM|nr:TrkH family potassium uptake protein [Kangiella sediminilitoris]AOE51014.1 Trk system potassium uptake protein [Kangiella sediminilitoris]
MQFATITRILGLLIMVFSLTMIPPSVVALIYQDGGGSAFFITFILSLISGFVIFFSKRHAKQELKIRDGFLVVSLFWTVLSLFGSLPFMLIENHALSLADAVFESFSGITTTGATVISGIDELPHSILFYRQQLQWLGGMGIIVLAVAILPMLGIGGMQLYRAETPGPIKDSKLTPRIAGTAKTLWFIYVGLTIACAISYWLAGMSAFDAIGHSFSTIATGGFSTHDDSIGYFDSDLIEMLCILFMFLGGVNFSLHFFAVRKLSMTPYLRDPEFRVYTMILLTVGLVGAIVLLVDHDYTSFYEAFLHTLFHTVSFATSSGFSTTDYYLWPLAISVLLIFVSFPGGSAGSTSGGMKVIRIILLFKQGFREIKRLIHPSGVFIIKLGKESVNDRIVNAVWGFFATYIMFFVIFMFILLSQGLDQVTAFSAVAATMNNLGPGLGEVSLNYGGLNDLTKYVLSFAMLLGRLEIFTLLVLFTPYFWRR